MSNGEATIINGKVYFGGGNSDNDSDKRSIRCYDISLDTWTTLPLLPVANFGIGQLDEKVVAIGGQKIPNLAHTNEWYKFNKNRKWKLKTPLMPIAVSSPAVVSLRKALVVAGGTNEQNQAVSSVSVFKVDTQQWLRCTPFLEPCSILSSVVINNQIFMLLGCPQRQGMNLAMCIHVDDLIQNAEAYAEDPTTIRSVKATWKVLPDTPMYQPTAGAILNKSLLAVGGRLSTLEEMTAQK